MCRPVESMKSVSHRSTMTVPICDSCAACSASLTAAPVVRSMEPCTRTTYVLSTRSCSTSNGACMGWEPLLGSPCTLSNLAREAVDRDDDEENDHDLADDPRVRVHPLAHLREEHLGAMAEHDDEQGRQAQEQQGEADEGKA